MGTVGLEPLYPQALAAYMHRHSFDARRSSFSTWLYTIARNKCVNARQKHRPLVWAELPEKNGPRLPEAILGAEKLFRQLDAGLASLSPEQKMVFGPRGAARAGTRGDCPHGTDVAVENAWATSTDALQLFTPTGELNTRARAEGIIAAALPILDDPVWAKTRRALTRPQLLTFLDRTHAQLAAVPVAPAVRDAAVQAEGLQQRPEGLQGAGPSAAALRGVLLATALVLTLSGTEGTVAVTQVQHVLRQAWRASSLVECVNSVARMQQSRHRRMTCGLLALKRLYWNCRTFRTGRRRQQTPYGLLRVTLPRQDWWELLKLAPVKLRQQLPAPGVAA